MPIGIDFDNTIVCYDALFHRVALEDGVIPADLPANKSDVRNHLRNIGREDVWTEMQGRVYGARMSEAEPYPGVLDFFRAARATGIPLFIVSHKTRYPYAGEPYDLHAAALTWLDEQGFFDPDGLGLPRDHVFFELTKQAKLERIAACGCTHFIDDLPELLAEPAFPRGVERILFDPNHLYLQEPRFPRIAAWPEAARHLAIPIKPPGGTSSASRPVHPGETNSASPTSDLPADREFAVLAAGFLSRSGLSLHGEAPALIPLPGGANNRVYSVRIGSRNFVLKRYFHAAGDPRDRFGAEHAFYRWISARGIRRTPQPVAWAREHRLGLFESIEGRKLTPAELTSTHVDQAVAFVAELNAERNLPAAASIPTASEACFSLAEHLERIGRRVDRLAQIAPATDIDTDALAFVRDQLTPSWHEVRARITARAGARLAESLPPERRCLSPSDFGFHNALVTPDGQVRFLDFEYAGWDDPAKLIGDFFSQPQVPVGMTYWKSVVSRIDEALGWRGDLETCAEWLLPAYRLKWCCILLNEFLPGERARRDFAAGDRQAAAQRRIVQLEKARKALAGIPTPE